MNPSARRPDAQGGPASFLTGYGLGMSQQEPGDDELRRVLEEWVATLTPEQLEELRESFPDAVEDEQN